MDEKRINEKESIEIISRMINDTRDRLKVGDGNALLYWGTLTVVVTAIVWTAVSLTHNAAWNWLWALMGAGWMINRRAGKEQAARGYVSYTDKVCTTVWAAVGILGFVGLALCFAFQLATDASPWMLMYVYALMVVGSGAIATGAALKVRSLVAGGMFGTAYGMAILCCVFTGTEMSAAWVNPLFMLSFVLMMIVPGLEIRKKARNGHERA